MPGVLLVECAAQTAGALWASMLAADTPRHFVLAQVLQFKFKQPIFPGTTIETEVMLENSLGLLAQFAAVLRVEGNEVARGRLVLSRE
jgi:3-hydroxymyristoyl/3-hydroxydecanoyl-(acyl carrier protein) dehydratase